MYRTPSVTTVTVEESSVSEKHGWLPRLRSFISTHSLPLLLLYFLCLQLASLLIFTGGFFLTRFELDMHQSCALPFHHDGTHPLESSGIGVDTVRRSVSDSDSGNITGLHDAGVADNDTIASSASSLSPPSCWYPRQYDRVVILLIDALRFDFMLWNHTLDHELKQARAQKQTKNEAGAAGSGGSTSNAEGTDGPSIPPFVNAMPIMGEILPPLPDERLHAPPSPSPHAGHAALYRFVADPPTVTMQRIKGLTTGGLPTFIDIKDNFGSSAIVEDNWIWQLKHAQTGRTCRNDDAHVAASTSSSRRSNVMHFFGDDTWFDLFPPHTYFSPQSRAYPSFNVKDLHTVDDGCWANLRPMFMKEKERTEREAELLGIQLEVDAEMSGDERFPHTEDNSDGGTTEPDTASPSSATSASSPSTFSSSSPSSSDWDVTLAHFLGVDHVGHRFDPFHPVMRDKLSQMNAIITKHIRLIQRQRQINESIRQQRTKRKQRPPAVQKEGSADDVPREQELLLIVMGDHGMTSDGNHGGQTEEEIYAGMLLYSTKPIVSKAAWSNAGQVDDSDSSDEGRILEEIRGHSLSALHDPSASAFSVPPLSAHLTSFLSIPQIDLVPTLSLLLGLPIPMGNLGKIIPELFWQRHAHTQSSSSAQEDGENNVTNDDDPRIRILQSRLSSLLPMVQALRLNAWQVHRYFDAYSSRADASTFTPQMLEEVVKHFERGEREWIESGLDEIMQEFGRDGGDSINLSSRLRTIHDLSTLQRLERGGTLASSAWYSYLHASSNLARDKWTAFDFVAMIRGVILGALGIGTLMAFLWYMHEYMQTLPLDRKAMASNSFQAMSQHPMHTTLRIILWLSACTCPLLLVSLLPLPDSRSRAELVSIAAFFELAWPCIGSIFICCQNAWKERRHRHRLEIQLPHHACRRVSERALMSDDGGSSWSAWRTSWSPPTFPTLVTVMVAALYAQGQFGDNFILNEANVLLYSTLGLAASWLHPSATVTLSKHQHHHHRAHSDTVTSVSESSVASRWPRRFHVSLLLISLCVMLFSSSSTAPDTSYRDSSKYSTFDVLIMMSALVALPCVTMRAAQGWMRTIQQSTNQAASMRMNNRAMYVQQILHYFLIPIAHLAIMLYWLLQASLPTSISIGTEQAATTEEGNGNGATSPSSPTHIEDPSSFVAVLCSIVGRMFAIALSILPLPLSWHPWIIRIVLPRTAYAISLSGLIAAACWPMRQTRKLHAADALHTGGVSTGNGHDISNGHVMTGNGNDALEDDVQLLRRRKVDGLSLNGGVDNSRSHAAHLQPDAYPLLSSTIWCLSILTFCSLISIPLMLVWGPKSPVLLLCVAACIWSLTSLHRFEHEKDHALASKPSAVSLSLFTPSELLFLFFLALHLFFTSGHSRASFSSLQVSCAFIGMDEFQYHIGGMLLMLNTFGHMIVGVGMLAMIMAMRRRNMDRSMMKMNEVNAAAFLPLSNAIRSSPSVARSLPFLSHHICILLLFSVLSWCRSYLSMLNVFIQRRHLMVWAIFAPRYIFDALAALVLQAMVLAVGTVAHRIDPAEVADRAER